MMSKRIPIFTLLLALSFCLQAQKNIPVSITELAELALSKNPMIQQNGLRVKSAQGALKVQKGVFDYNLFSSASITRNSLNLFSMDPRDSLIDGNLNTNGFITSIGVVKRFRSGLSANVSVNYNSLSDNLGLNRFNEVVSPNITDHYMTSSLSLRQPLWRGRGPSIATALEKSAALDLQSARSNLSYANSVQIYEVTTAYWNYLSAFERANIYRQNEDRVRKMLEVTKDLVAGDKKPKGDLDQVRADLANQERLSQVAQQSLVAAKLNLGRAIGLSEEESFTIGRPLDNFPTINGSGFQDGMSLEPLKQMARENRKDVESNQLYQESLNLQMKLANNNLKPQLDLLASFNYGGSAIGNGWSNYWDTFTNSQGRDVGFELGLRFDFPVNNNQAQGALAQSKALYKDQEIYTQNLSRNIDLNVAIATTNIKNSTEILRNARRSLDYYQQVYENEQVKFQNGLSTILNLIIFQERLTVAQLEYLNARQQFAFAIITLRFETGTLYTQDDFEGSRSFNPSIFYTIPLPN